MKKKPYKRKPGDFEIRILKNNQTVFIAPDQQLMDIAENLKNPDKEKPKDDRAAKKD